MDFTGRIIRQMGEGLLFIYDIRLRYEASFTGVTMGGILFSLIGHDMRCGSPERRQSGLGVSLVAFILWNWSIFLRSFICDLAQIAPNNFLRNRRLRRYTQGLRGPNPLYPRTEPDFRFHYYPLRLPDNLQTSSLFAGLVHWMHLFDV
jgi:hypothetical protein